jgi:hypothetical protein
VDHSGGYLERGEFLRVKRVDVLSCRAASEEASRAGDAARHKVLSSEFLANMEEK